MEYPLEPNNPPLGTVALTQNDALLHILRANVRVRADFVRRNIELILGLTEAGLITNRDPENGPGQTLYLTPKGSETLCLALASKL